MSGQYSRAAPEEPKLRRETILARIALGLDRKQCHYGYCRHYQPGLGHPTCPNVLGTAGLKRCDGGRYGDLPHWAPPEVFPDDYTG